jgi:glycosyltransferase involved in cell wall biosynthesis
VRIGLVAPPWQPVPPPGYGAIELLVGGLAAELTALGHAVVLAATGDSTAPGTLVPTYARARPDALQSISVETVNVLEAYDALAHHDLDVVHDHTMVGPPLAAARGFPVVTTAHWSLGGDVGRLYRRMAPLLPVVAISHAQRRAAPDMPVAAVIHHGVDVDAVRPGDGTGRYALVLARMSPDKGVHLAVLAARQAGVPLVIAGPARDDAEREYLDRVLRPMLGDGARYVGEALAGDKQRLLADALAVLMPAQWDEPFGLVAIEALAAGTPVVAFPRGALPEIVEDGRTGLLCEGVDGMADALRRVGELDRAACRAAAEQRFSLRRMAEEHLALYADVAAR